MARIAVSAAATIPFAFATGFAATSDKLFWLKPAIHDKNVRRDIASGSFFSARSSDIANDSDAEVRHKEGGIRPDESRQVLWRTVLGSGGDKRSSERSDNLFIALSSYKICILFMLTRAGSGCKICSPAERKLAMKKGKPAKANIKTNLYTTTEVGTLLEAIQKDIKIIAEGHTGLDNKLEKVEVALHGNNRRLDSLEFGFSVMSGKVTRLEDAVSLLSKEVREVKSDLVQTKNELKKDIGEVKKELKADIQNLGERLTTVETR